MKKVLVLAILLSACSDTGSDKNVNHDLINYAATPAKGTVANAPWEIKTAYVTHGDSATQFNVQMYDLEIEPCTLVASPDARLVKVAFDGSQEETKLSHSFYGTFEYYQSSVKNSEKAEDGKISVGDLGESEVSGKVIVAHAADYVNGSFTAKRCE